MYEKLKARSGAIETELQTLIGIEQEIRRLITEHQLDTDVLTSLCSPVTMKGMEEKWTEVQSLLSHRSTEQLADLAQRQQSQSLNVKNSKNRLSLGAFAL